MSVQLGSVADAGSPADSLPPLAAIDSLAALTLAAGEARGVALDGRALLIYVRFGVLTIGGDRRAARALPGELVLIDGEQSFSYANASKAEELSVLEVLLGDTSDSTRTMQRYFSDDDKANKLCLIASQAGTGDSLALNRSLDVSLTKLARWETVLLDLEPSRVVWVVGLNGEVTVNNEAVAQGASACVSDADELRISGVSSAEVIVMAGAARA